jgi:hypothetical protein
MKNNRKKKAQNRKKQNQPDTNTDTNTKTSMEGKILYCFWPHVEKIQKTENSIDDNYILDASWKKKSIASLEEARRLRDEENNRLRRTETRAQIYLVGLLGLIPILLSLTEFTALKSIMVFNTWYSVTGFILFSIGITYGIGAFVSSYLVLEPGPYHRLTEEGIADAGRGKLGEIEILTKMILISIRQDRPYVDLRVERVKVTHDRVFRMALFLFSAILLMFICSAPGLSLL